MLIFFYEMIYTRNNSVIKKTKLLQNMNSTLMLKSDALSESAAHKENCHLPKQFKLEQEVS